MMKIQVDVPREVEHFATPRVLFLLLAAVVVLLATIIVFDSNAAHCARTCEALYADYVVGTDYGCVCEDRDLTDAEQERAARRFLAPMGGAD